MSRTPEEYEHEIERLRSIIRDLVDFDIGEEPMLDSLCGADGPRQISNMFAAWEAAVEEVGCRRQDRFYNVTLPRKVKGQ